MKYQNELNGFVQKLKDSNLQSNLLSLLLYGKHLRIKDHDSNVFSLLFVFEKIDLKVLQELSEIFAKEVEIEILPFILTQEELQKSADVYPIKFMDISENHEVLIGKDPFDRVEVHKDNLRLRCEQELRNIALRLRFAFVKNEGDLRYVRMETQKSLYPMMNNLEVALMIKTNKIINAYDQLLENCSSKLKLETKAVEALLSWSEGNKELSNEEFLTVFEEYRNFLDHLIQLIDSH